MTESVESLPHVPAPAVESVAVERQPERSTIKFPYSDVDDAVQVARAIKETHGTRCTLDQLAATLSQSIRSGAFRTKVATAGTFGAVESTRGSVELTELGHRLADDHTRPAAMVEAFFNVPLYRAIYERYQGKNLPSDAGLNNDIRTLGVVSNQVDRARQVLQRTAEKAGFFWGGRNRLVIPPSGRLPDESAAVSVPTSVEPDSTGAEASPLSDPMLAGLFKRMLPPEGQAFLARDRRRFFRALAMSLDVIYGEPTDGELDPDELARLFRVEPARSTPAPSLPAQ